MNEEIMMLKIFLSIFILIGFFFRYTTEDDWYKIFVDIFLILAFMYFVWC